MFGRKKQQILSLEKLVAELQQQVAALTQQSATPRVDLNTALDTVLVKAVESTVGMADRVNQLTMDNIKLAAGLQQQQMRKVGGRVRARTAARNLRGSFERDCRLCDNPSIVDPTPAEILAHANHRPRRDRPPAKKQPEQLPLPYRVENGKVRADADESEVETAADGSEQIECADCAAGVAHQHQ